MINYISLLPVHCSTDQIYNLLY